MGSPVTSAVRTPNGKGYWILTANGTVYNSGDAASDGDAAGAIGGLNPATAIFTTSDGGGYWIASANGTVDQYGDAPNDGGVAGTYLKRLHHRGDGILMAFTRIISCRMTSRASASRGCKGSGRSRWPCAERAKIPTVE
jgi:hypothetical protein